MRPPALACRLPLLLLLVLRSLSAQDVLFLPAPGATVQAEGASAPPTGSPGLAVKAAAALQARIPATVIPPAGNSVQTCWAVVRDFPARACTRRSNVCTGLDASRADACTFCNRGGCCSTAVLLWAGTLAAGCRGAAAHLEEQRACTRVKHALARARAAGRQRVRVLLLVVLLVHHQQACMHTVRPLPAGWGVYRTEQDCLSAGGGTAQLSGIDPGTYSPPLATASACGQRTVTADGDACPHKWPSARRWEDAATWPSGAVPAAGSAVRLPPSTSVVLSGCSQLQGTFHSITIPQGSQVGTGA